MARYRDLNDEEKAMYKERVRKYREEHQEEYNERKRKRRAEDHEYREKERERNRKRRDDRRKEYNERRRKRISEHREEYYERRRKRYSERREERYKRLCEYRAEDLNKYGSTKHYIRTRSYKYLLSKHSRIPGYEIHHCFGYEDPKKFIYIPKQLHIEIHQILRDNNIPADSDHWMAIRDMVNSCDQYTYISC